MRTPIQVIEMLARLHQLGYQRLRLSAGISPTGLNWRYSVAPVDQFGPNGYQIQRRHYPVVARGTTRGDDPPFEWEGAAGSGPDLLAATFLERFPEVAAAGHGHDADYAAWFAEAVAKCRPNGALIMYGEDIDVAASGCIGTNNGQCVPLPPVAGLPGRPPSALHQ